MSETDSFIDEVTEEVRRDKLFVLMRKYGWIAGVLVVLIVGGAAYNEWRKASQSAAAQALGDAIAAAMTAPQAADRADALADIRSEIAGTEQFLWMMQAAQLAEAGDKVAALALLDKIAAATDTPDLYRSLARFKAVVLRGNDQDRDARMAVLDQLAEPGSAFRVIAMEQKALAFIQYGNKDQAIAILGNILEEPQVTEALRQRAQQLIVSLGGKLSADGSRLVQDS